MFYLSIHTSPVVDIIINLLYFAIVFGTIIVILLDNRNPVKTIAWVLVLTFLPFIGLVFYFFFGRSTRRERLISKKSYNRLFEKPIAAFQSYQVGHLPKEYQSLIHFFKNTDGSIPLEADEVDIYTNGYSKMQALLRAIQGAKQHIHIEYYIFLDDAIGHLIKDALIERTTHGVQVRLIYDDVGSWQTPNLFFEELRDAGVEVRSFMKVRFPLFTSKVNYRNHRKIVVVDGEIGFIGGMNIATRYVKGLSWGEWRDTHLRISGRAVHGLQMAFLQDWYFVDQTLLTSPCYFPEIANSGSILTQVVTSGPVGAWKKMMRGFIMAISTAQQYVYIQTPYFLPSESLLGVMQTAALAGIDIRLMVPQRSDNQLTHFGTCSYLKKLLDAGVKVYFYKKGFLHAKTMVIDDSMATVGSTNFDFRSFEHNFEINAFMYNTEVALNLKETFIKDLRDCEQITNRRWSERPILFRVMESFVRLLSPLL